MNITDYIKGNSVLKSLLKNNDSISIKILSNISFHQIKPILEYSLGHRGIKADVIFGEYDNIVQDSIGLSESEVPIIVYELANLKNGFIFEIESMDDDFCDLFFNKIKLDLEMIFNNLSDSKLVLFNKFSHILFSHSSIRKTKFEKFVCRLNQLIEDRLPNNFVLVDIDKPIYKISSMQAIDQRGIYMTKTFYSFDFIKSYVEFITPIFCSIYGKSKKALILDCDNTLWKGIIGEDGVNGISLAERDKNGSYFREVHLIIKKLLKDGVIIGLCSKNNIEDVLEVFDKREDFILKSTDFAIKKINWNLKSDNLKEIVDELNIGIDSLVFMDDSNFEVSLVNDALPEVETILVPEKLHDYPLYFFNKLNLFFKNSITAEDEIRGLSYYQNELREKEKSTHLDLDEYLKSLKIHMELKSNDQATLDRVEQLTQKTNQFNLTTYRYTKAELERFINSERYDVITLNVKDKFGDMGLTGVCILEYGLNFARIDLLLLSCRVLGRKIEKVFISEIIKRVSSRNIKILHSSYIRSAKNVQVSNFYPENNFTLVKNEKSKFDYELHLPIDNMNEINYINCLWKVK